MARGIYRLSAAEVRTKTTPGYFSDGGGLYLQVSKWGTKSWVFKFTVNGRTRGMGLGPVYDTSNDVAKNGLAKARDEAERLRSIVRAGRDPIEERNAARKTATAEARKAMTFNDAIERCLAKKDGEFKNDKHREQWRSTLANYAGPVLGDMDVAHITMQDVLRVLEPIWTTKTETASRIRGRMEAVLSWATVAGYRSGDNPARWNGNLKELLPKPSAVAEKDNQPALSLADLPGWFGALKKRDGIAARALEFLTLCAARSGEVRGATWDEIDLEAGLWIVPAIRIEEANVRKLLSRFERGEVGDQTDDGARVNKLRELINRYFERPAAEFTGSLEGLKEMRERGVVPERYLFQRTANLSAFKNARNGSKLALKHAIEQLISFGEIARVSNKDLPKLTNSHAALYTLAEESTAANGKFKLSVSQRREIAKLFEGAPPGENV
jgi:integrase